MLGFWQAVTVVVLLTQSSLSARGNPVQIQRKEREYNHVNFVDLQSYPEFASVYLTGGRANRNLLIGVYGDDCRRDVETVAFRGAQRHSGNVLQVISLPTLGFPLPLETCSELFLYRFNSTMADPYARTTDFDHTHVNNWVAESLRTDFRVRNGFDFPIVFYWQDESQRGKKQKLLAPGQATTINSFLGHVFSAHRDTGLVSGDDSDDEESGEMVDFMVVDGNFYEFHPTNRLETCEIVPGSASSKFIDAEQISCDNMRMRFVEFSHNVWYEKRLALNYIQPALVEPVTDMGFENRRLPDATFKWLREWFAEKQLSDSQIEGPVGPCMNQHVAESIMTHLSPDKKNQLSAELNSILEEWYGKGKLDLTSIYGIRRYTNGSVLRMHVDTVNTHVVSAIINVDQKVDKDWPLIILDHQDNEHTVFMQPGDMLLYESAKLLHGRPEPFRGTSYDNIFIHYKPKEGWNYDWL